MSPRMDKAIYLAQAPFFKLHVYMHYIMSRTCDSSVK